MKQITKIVLPILLALAILFGVGWYFFEYDTMLTQTILMDLSHHFSNRGDYDTAAWLNNLAFNHFGNNAAVPIEQAELYLSLGNYTQAERVLHSGIENGGGVELYAMLSKVYAQQDKLLDAAELLDNITEHAIKKEIDALRPASPVPSIPAGEYHEYASVTFSTPNGTCYVKEGSEYPSIAENLHSSEILLHDGENHFTCIAVNGDGLVSSLAKYTFVVGGVIEEVTFKDSAMESAIRNALNKPADTTIYSNEIWQLRSFEIPKEAKDYSELRYMPYLQELTIDGGMAGQLHYLEGMPDLKTLTISNTVVSTEELTLIGNLKNLENLTLNSCSLSSITPLATLTNLLKLDISGNAIRDLKPIASMKKLEELKAQRNAINDLSAISSNIALLVLDVSNNSVSDLAPLFSLIKLQRLDARFNSVASLSGMAQLSHLKHLDLSNNALTDVNPLADCTQLENLNLASNNISDIQSLSTLVNMTDFVFSHNKVTKLPSWKRSCQLQNITGDHNDIRSLAPLAGFMRLNCVYMDYNPNLSDVNVLKDCQVLFRVDVFGTKVKDVSALTELSVTVNYNPVA